MGNRRRVRQHGEGSRDLDQREGVGGHSAGIGRDPEQLGRGGEDASHRRLIEQLDGMVGPPVLLERPFLDPAQQEQGGMLAGAHVAHRPRSFAVARQASRGQRVERRALRSAAQKLLRDAGPAEDRLQRSNVEVLAGMRTRHDRQLGVR